MSAGLTIEGKYKLGYKLGSGSFGTIYSGIFYNNFIISKQQILQTVN